MNPDVLCQYAKSWYGKPLLMFKLTVMLMLLTSFQSYSTGYAQNSVSLSEKNAPLWKVFKKIRQQTGYFFIVRDQCLDKAKPVTIVVKNADLTEVMKLCLHNQPLMYEIVEKTIIVKLKPETQSVSKHTIGGSVQQIDVTGRVLNERGEPIVASISVKGTNRGTSTNADGEFFLAGVDENVVLVISSVGYETRELPLNNQSSVVVVLQQRQGKLDEVQIIAYGTTTRRLKTGSIAKVSSSEIEQQPVTDPIAAMQGRVPGLFISQGSSVPGAYIKVQLRGINSIANGNDPLYIIDGVPFGPGITNNLMGGGAYTVRSPLNIINPSDIEQIQVLKDADATAIYGSRGANGVILINTKKGKEGKTQFNFNLIEGGGKAVKKMQLLNRRQYLDMRYEAFQNDGTDWRSPDQYANDLKVWDTARDTDWQDVFFGNTARYRQIQASVSGGSALTTFLISGTYNKFGTILPGEYGEEKIGGNVSVQHQSTNKKFTAGLTAGFTTNYNRLPQSNLRSYVFLSPVAPALYDAEGELNWENDTWENPLRELESNYKSTSGNLLSNLTLAYAITAGLEFKTTIGYNRLEAKDYFTLPKTYWSPSFRDFIPSFAYLTDLHLQTVIAEPQLSYHFTKGKNELSVLGGTTLQQTDQSSITYEGSNFSSDAFINNISAAANLRITRSNNTSYHYAAVYGRVNYNWSKKYLLNLTARRDGSSRFGPGKQFANFGAVGAGWIFTREPWMKNQHFLSFGKIRGSHGITGNDQIGDYRYLPTYSFDSYNYAGNRVLQPQRLFNPDYRWEKVLKTEAAIELGFLKDRLLFEMSVYKNKTSNQLINYPLSSITGFEGVLRNLPAVVENKGTEINISSVNIQTADVRYTTDFNISFNRNVLKSYPDIKNSSYANRYTVGKSLAAVKMYHYIGLDPTTGLYLFEDVNKDGNINFPEDFVSSKTVAPEYYGGLNNSLAYKNFQLDVFIHYVRQQGRTIHEVLSTPGLWYNQPTEVLNRWRKPGDQAAFQPFTATFDEVYQNHNISSSSDLTFGDASFIRLKNVQFCYTVPRKYLERINIQQFRLFIQAQNLLTISDYYGFDPETQNSVPPLRMLTGGLSITL
jgi:TonB-dependent starch-binding outer membrane protein SusC